MASMSSNAGDLFSVNGLIAVVTGGGTGIGLMIAKALEANGATVYIVGRRKEVLEKAAGEAKSGNIIPLVGDVTSKSDLDRIVSIIAEKTGYLNLVVANSGISGPSIHGLARDASVSAFRSFLWESDSDAFTKTFAVNNTAVFYTVIAFLELLDKGNKKANVVQKSQVIATSSIGAFNRVPLAGYAYGSSKAGVVHLMKQFATTLVEYDIRSNVIAPGYYPSQLTEGMLKAKEETGFTKAEVPLQRAGNEDDMAGVILFLASRAGAYINGNVVVTDGGRLSVLPATY